ncbi:MAG: hypothetical protein ACT4PV_03120 [Planctomycetaceae bacterium]
MILPASLAVVTPGDLYAGKTYEQWTQEWWRWLMGIPSGINPAQAANENLQTNQSGPVFFLTGVEGPVTRSVTVPQGTAILFPMINVLMDFPCPDPAFQPAPGQTLLAFLRGEADALMSLVIHLEAEIDGVPIPDLFNNRITTGLFSFTGHPSLTNFDPCITGSPQQGLSDGYWILVNPLPVGTHRIHLRGRIVFPDLTVFDVETDYVILVSLT